MNAKQIAVSTVLVLFSSFTGWIVATVGFVEAMTLATAHVVHWQTLLDLGIALTVCSVWMWRDARERGIHPLPHLLLVLCTGSIGILVYVIRRIGVDATTTHVVPAPVGHAKERLATDALPFTG